MLQKKRQEFCLKLIAQDVWGQKFWDKYHKKKKRETKEMCLCLRAYTTHSEAKIWFVSGTWWSTSPQDLDEIFVVLYIKNKWDKHPRLKKIKSQEYIKLISEYKAILNRKSNVPLIPR